MTAEENLYGSKAAAIPTPCFVIFYNGAEPQPDRKILRLSDLYTVKMEEAQLELTAVLLNINRNHKPGTDGSLPGSEGLCRICGQSKKICQRTVPVGGSGTCHCRVYPGRDPEGVSGEEPDGGEENEYIRIRSGKTYPDGEAGRLGGWSTGGE